MKKILLTSMVSMFTFLQAMSQKNFEIELKFKASIEETIAFENNFVQFDSILLRQEEVYVLGRELTYLEVEQYKMMKQYMRVRKAVTCSFLTLKQRTEEGVIELETKIEDSNKMLSILAAIGYGAIEDQRVLLEKDRKIYLVPFENNEIEIVFDQFIFPNHMKDMGAFVEIELKSYDGSYEDGIKILKRFLLHYGFKEIEQYPPYIEIALNPDLYRGKIKKINCQLSLD